MAIQRISPYLLYNGYKGVTISASEPGGEDAPWTIMDGNTGTRWRPLREGSITFVFQTPIIISRVRLRTQPTSKVFKLYMIDDKNVKTLLTDINHLNAVEYWSETNFKTVRGTKFEFYVSESAFLYELEFWGQAITYLLELRDGLYTITTKGLELVSQNTEGSFDLYKTKGFEINALNSTIQLDGKLVPIMDVISSYSHNFKLHALN